MTDLQFECLGARPDRYAAAPTLLFDLRVRETTGARVHALVLRTQIRVEPAKRRYSDEEAERLLDLFGERPRWADTQKALQLASVAVALPGFTGETEVALPVPCTYDLEVAPTRYLHALGDGEAPLLLLFSGTVFFAGGGSGLQVEQVPWDREVSYRLPAAVWRELMDRYFPDSAWLRLRRSSVDALGRVKSREALPTWDETVERVLKQAGEEPP
ncbi:MAG: DUF6084 family protein [Actinomycetes bacterium]